MNEDELVIEVVGMLVMLRRKPSNYSDLSPPVSTSFSILSVHLTCTLGAASKTINLLIQINQACKNVAGNIKEI
ncbi:unnamed protein product [Gongylonema pulchrum]|uniref:Ovule protein n=1 Tax=Gongylonema pulchrum TaxID=637853 RepID=A0A183CVR9_9BILA|nr:unnamed protein product [Gongylonema pulchrum]